MVAAVAPQSYQSPPLETISIASQQFVINPADIILHGTTVSAGGPAVTFDGDVVYEDGNEDIFVNGVEVLTGPTGIAKTAFSSSSKFTSQSRFCHADVPGVLLKS